MQVSHVIIVGDINIHVDFNNLILSAAFISLLDVIGFSHSVYELIQTAN